MARIGDKYRHKQITDITYVMVGVEERETGNIAILDEIGNPGHRVRVEIFRLSHNYTKVK